MAQPTIFYTSPSLFRKVNDRPSKVRETARKFENLEKSNSLSPSHHSSLAIKINHNNRTATNENLTPSSSSLSDSSISESPIEQRQRPSTVDEQSLPDSMELLTKPHISTARIEIRSPSQHAPTPRTRRILPTPRSASESKQDEGPIYENRRKDVNNNIDDEEETTSAIQYAKPIIHHREIPIPSSVSMNQHFASRLRNSSFRNGIERPPAPPPPRPIQNRLKSSDVDSIGLDNDESISRSPRPIPNDKRYLTDQNQRVSSLSTNYETTEDPERSHNVLLSSHRLPPRPPPPPPPGFAKPSLQNSQTDSQEEAQPYVERRSLPLSNFMLELGALLVVLIICMVLATAIREGETELQTTMQIFYTYIYLVSIVWMIWCILDILKFRRQWAELTSNAYDHEEYMDITERYSQNMFYFPDIHNTGGLFMRVGAGLFCMGGLILTVIEIAKTIAKIEATDLTARAAAPSTTYSSSATITTLITYICRFLFHCVQYSFLFRYGNLVINRYHLIAKIGLIHIVIANFCTWLQAIVTETLEQMHHYPSTYPSTTFPMPVTTNNDTNAFYFTAALSAADSTGTNGNNKTALEILYELESSIAVYLFPCLIEYSLISLTVFFIMWRNVGKNEKRSFLRFGDRHVFTVNCARASRGLILGGIILLLTVATLIPTYLFEEYTTSFTDLTGLVLLVVSLCTVCLSYFYTTKLFYDHHAHVDVFDEVLIFLTTVADFAYSIFGLFASFSSTTSNDNLPAGVEIAIGFLAIFQTFLQSAFIMDTLKRRTRTKQENRNKPGRETITALLLMNLAIWMHDSLSAKKVRLNSSQVAYYNIETWAIIQAFTAPLSIFYRFHSCVCLADIWQEVYHDRTRLKAKTPMLRLVTLNGGGSGGHDN